MTTANDNTLQTGCDVIITYSPDLIVGVVIDLVIDIGELDPIQHRHIVVNVDEHYCKHEASDCIWIKR